MNLNINLLKDGRLFLIRFILAMSICSSVASGVDVNNEKNVLVIATMTDNAPYGMVTPNGEISGYYSEFWQLWGEANNTEIKFLTGDFPTSLANLRRGKADIHSGLFSNDERRKEFVFSIPIDKIDSGFFYLKNTKLIKSINDLSEEKVAIHPEYEPVDFVRKNHPNLRLVYRKDPRAMIEALLENKVSGFVGEVPFIETKIEGMGLQGKIVMADYPVSSNYVAAVALKSNRAMIETINSGIDKIPFKALQALEKKWFPNKEQFYVTKNKVVRSILTQQEFDYLDSLGELSIGIDPDWAPFEYFDNGEYQGISSDYVRILSQKISKSLKPKPSIPWREVLNKIKRKEIDILPAVIKRENNHDYLNFSVPYSSIPLAVVIRKGITIFNNVNDLSLYSVGVESETALHEIMRKEYPNVELVEYDSKESGLDLLAQGSFDVLIGNLDNVSLRIKQDYPNLEVASVLPNEIIIRFGVRKGLEPLVPIIDKVLTSIKLEEKMRIRQTWSSLYLVQGNSLLTYAFWTLPFLLTFLLISYIVYRYNTSLKLRISEKISAQKSLELAKRKSEEANNNKNQFLSNMSHEIRTPLNALIGMNHLLNSTQLSSEQKDYLDTMDYSANTLLLLVDDIVDLNRVESGKLNLQVKEFKLEKLLKNISSQTKNTLLSKPVTFSYSVDDDVPKYFISDQHRIGQILTNLINNAVKFTSDGNITLSVQNLITLPKDKIEPAANYDQSILQIELTDTGIGMTDEQSKNIFKAYSQAEQSTAREYGGTGLGLMICKKLCELMGGAIWVDSKLREGSRFIFTLKLFSSNEPESTDTKKSIKIVKEDSEFTNVEILVVEDNLVNLTIVKKILQNKNIKVTTAMNGKIALETVVKKLNQNERFDAVLMDIQMPVMDGYQSTREIRQLLDKNELPIIALSANVMQKDKEKSIRSGMNAHLSKPVNVSLLLDTLKSNIGVK